MILDRGVGLGSRNERALGRRLLIYERGGFRLLVLLISPVSPSGGSGGAHLLESWVLSGI
jgi:hypothetical protein